MYLKHEVIRSCETCDLYDECSKDVWLCTTPKLLSWVEKSDGSEDPGNDIPMVSVAEVRRALGISMPKSGPLFNLLMKAERGK